ncbi:MAG TPA: FAD-dependent oxidoreductase, partial [Steroidobacteraceae bacterium]
AMVMEPVGGMDRVPAGFMRHVGPYVRLHAQVEAVQLMDRGVRVVYHTRGTRTVIDADYCLNCIPMHLMSGIEHNFPTDYAAGLAAVPRGRLFKIGFQMKQRFWEQENIYGGISWTSQDIQQLWYPPHGIHRQKGVMLGAYTFSDAAGEKFARLTHPERLQLAIQQAEKLHPDFGSYVEHGVSIPWARMNNMLGCAAAWSTDLRSQWYQLLQAPTGNHYIIGDQMSYLPGWQEGAMYSAFHALADIDQRERQNPRSAAA